MPMIFLGLGSNIEPCRHLLAGLDMLSATLGEMSLSPVYESSAVGFVGDPFLNLVAGAPSDMSLEELLKVIKRIEDANGRDRSGPKFGPRSLDIDILTYGDLVGQHEGVWLPRDESREQAYVLRPIAELAANRLLPGTDRTYAELWAAFDQASQPLIRVDFAWRGRLVSEAQSQ